MDEIDIRILTHFQQDSTISMTSLADRVGLSPSPCWRRLERLQANGVIQRRVALLDPHKLNVDGTVFVNIRTNRHSAAWAERFCEEICRIPEVMEFYRMSGTFDYLLKVVVPSISAYDAVYKRITAISELFDVTSSFSMEQIKYTTCLPLTYAKVRGA